MLRLRIQRIATPAMARTATPPTTLPATTPVLFEPPPLLGGGVAVGEGVGLEGVGEGMGVLFGVAPEVREVRPAVLRTKVSHVKCRRVKVMTTHTLRRLVPVQHRRCLLSSCRSQVSKRRHTARGVPEVVEQRVRNASVILILVEGVIRATFQGSVNRTATAFSVDRTLASKSIERGRGVRIVGDE